MTPPDLPPPRCVLCEHMRRPVPGCGFPLDDPREGDAFRWFLANNGRLGWAGEQQPPCPGFDRRKEGDDE